MVDLKTIINELKGSYNNIDIRAVVFSSNNDNKRYCAFLKIHFTKEEEKVINNEYSTMEENSHIPKSKSLEVIHECIEIKNINVIFEQIQNQVIILKGEEYIIYSEDCRNILNPDKSISRDDSGFYKSSIDREFNYLIFTINYIDDQAFNYIFQKNNIKLKDHSIENLNDFNYFLDIENMDYKNNLVIIFPLYYKIKQPLPNDNQVIDCIMIHKSLKDKLNIILTNTITKKPFKKFTRPVYNNDINNELLKGYIKRNQDIEITDSFTIKISIGQLENIYEYTKNGIEILQQLSEFNKNIQLSTSIIPSFKLFRAFDFFRQNFHCKDSETQVQLSCQLLSLINFAVINLGSFGNDGEQLKDKNSIHSLDILAYNEKKSIFLAVDCTITIPSQPKINKIFNTAKYLSQETNKNFIPVIISQEEVPYRVDSDKFGVVIIDKNDIESLLELIDNNNVEELEKVFREKILTLSSINNTLNVVDLSDDIF